ncbi:hypothetical protein PIB30_032580 [Stylosanthes scabra]|uniref:Uncharacterized protein n=1 Tax=Stylosanthes scabra TaxID=79078 RepID=A0ABU6SCB7_9FABA|nr:hypothetical protein [Stylosanthes scabra]
MRKEKPLCLQEKKKRKTLASPPLNFAHHHLTSPLFIFFTFAYLAKKNPSLHRCSLLQVGSPQSNLVHHPSPRLQCRCCSSVASRCFCSNSAASRLYCRLFLFRRDRRSSVLARDFSAVDGGNQLIKMESMFPCILDF